MTRISNANRLRGTLFGGIIALVPALAMAQTQQSPPPASTPQAAPPAGGGMMGHPMMMDDKMKPGMGGMDCMGKPCGPPQGTPGPMGGMPQAQGGTGSPGAAAPPAAPPAPMKDHM